MLCATRLCGAAILLAGIVGCTRKDKHAIVAEAPSDAAVRQADAVTVDAAVEAPLQIATRDALTLVYAKPRQDSSLIAGFLRSGVTLERGREPVEGEGCRAGWYAVKPFGFLCGRSSDVTLDPKDPMVVLTSQYAPQLEQVLPYGYGTSLGTPLYVRVPTREQARQVEGENFEAEAKARWRAWEHLPEGERGPKYALDVGPVPDFLKDHAMAPGPKLTKKGTANGITTGEITERTGLSFLSAFESEGRVYYLTTEYFIVPADRVRPAKLSSFHGVELAAPEAEGDHLPMLWAHLSQASLYRYSDGRAKKASETLPLRGHVSIHPKSLNVGGTQFYELVKPPEGAPDARYLIRTDAGVRVDATTDLPRTVGENDAWLDVNLKTQALVMYKGQLPVFVTLVSTGLDRAQDWRTARSTPQGLYRIATKQVSSRMQSSPKKSLSSDSRYRVDDVPYAQHFFRGYALHAAYWHESFGMPVSHGCINLSPMDAKALFSKTLPTVPTGWHGVVSDMAGSEKGTWLRVRAE